MDPSVGVSWLLGPWHYDGLFLVDSTHNLFRLTVACLRCSSDLGRVRVTVRINVTVRVSVSKVLGSEKN